MSKETCVLDKLKQNYCEECAGGTLKMMKKDFNKMSKKELIKLLEKKKQTSEPTEKVGIQIKNRYTDEVIYESKTATTIKECVEQAVEEKADLSEANLSEANLSEADLSEAGLWKADLSEANLSKADLWKADLSEANLSKANLSKAGLSEANLSKANLSKAGLWKANLVYCKMDKKVKKQIIEEWFEWDVVDEN